MFRRHPNHHRHIRQAAACFLTGLVLGYATAKKFRRDEFGLQVVAHYSILAFIALKLTRNLPEQMQAGVGIVLGIVAGYTLELAHNAADTYTNSSTIRLG